MNVLSNEAQKQVEAAIINEGLISEADLGDLKSQAAANNEPLITYLVSQKLINDEQLTKILSEVNDVPYVNLSNVKIGSKTLELLPKDTAEHFMAVPLGEMDDQLVVAMLDAANVQAVDFLSEKIGRPLKVYAGSESGIKRVIAQYSSNLESGVASILSKGEEQSNAADAAAGMPTPANTNAKVIVQDSPVSKALAAIMEYAANSRASDIHIEPMEHELKIRCRVDGVLTDVMELPKSTEAALVSRIKILSNLKIDEHRIPQDGQFTINVGGKDIDLRIAISPVVWGEEVVIRLLDKSGTSLKLEDLGYTGRNLRLLRNGVKQTSGMVLTSGPTGSGKSTSMYALIQEIKSESINIITLEDPVEYKIDGVNQIQVNPDVGLTFASGLRSILRQDPDVVMVGEIRDKETANLAIQASLTGHLVFATLHTNSAAGILPRLLDMGVEPFLIASTVHTVIGQRLVRRIIPGGEIYKSSPADTKSIHDTVGNLLPKTEAEVATVSADLGYTNLPLANQSAYTLAKGKATPDNPGGYKGRLGIYEVFEVTPAIQDLILKRSPSTQIEKAAIAQGMVTMRQDGYLKALAGLTTLNEVSRVAAADIV